jgi:Cu/Ag efflux pump CusA
MTLADDQTIPTREAIQVMQTNALYGVIMVLAVCWLFLGAKIGVLVSLGIPFSLLGTFAVLAAMGHTVNVSVLLGVVIALGMLVDDAVVIVEAIYYRIERGQQALQGQPRRHRRSLGAGAGVGGNDHGRFPAADAAAGNRRQVHVHHPLRGHPGAADLVCSKPSG